MKRTAGFFTTVSMVALALTGVSATSASASPAQTKAVFCADVNALTAVPVLELPTSIDFGSIIDSLNTLSADQATLHRNLNTLSSLIATAPTPTLKAWYQQAGVAGANEVTGLASVLSNATTLLNGNKSNNAILSVASAASQAASDGAVTNTYLQVAKPFALAACAHWPGAPAPKPKPKPKPKPVVKPKRK
jgi:hypothetical protein